MDSRERDFGCEEMKRKKERKKERGKQSNSGVVGDESFAHK